MCEIVTLYRVYYHTLCRGFTYGNDTMSTNKGEVFHDRRDAERVAEEYNLRQKVELPKGAIRESSARIRDEPYLLVGGRYYEFDLPQVIPK